MILASLSIPIGECSSILICCIEPESFSVLLNLLLICGFVFVCVSSFVFSLGVDVCASNRWNYAPVTSARQ